MKASRVESKNRESVESGIPTRLFEPDAEEVEAVVEATRRLREQDLSELTKMERKVFVSVEREGMTPSELADFDDFPGASTIRTHLRRAREKREKREGRL